MAFSFIIAEASTLSHNRKQRINLERWEKHRRESFQIPIDATISDNHIEIQFLESCQSPTTLLIQDKDGNIVFQDTVVSEEQMIYKIDLQGFNVGQYELIYIVEDMTFSGEFEVE